MYLVDPILALATIGVYSAYLQPRKILCTDVAFISQLQYIFVLDWIRIYLSLFGQWEQYIAGTNYV